MDSREVGEELYRIRREVGPVIDALLSREAMRRVPLIYENNIPTNLLDVRAEIIQVYKEYKVGSLVLNVDGSRLVEKGPRLAVPEMRGNIVRRPSKGVA